MTDTGHPPGDAAQLAECAEDIERALADTLVRYPYDVPGPALLACLRLSASLIALAPDTESFEQTLRCAKDILDQRSRTHTSGTLH